MASILVVDDEVDVLDALGRALRLAGHTVSQATKAPDAIQMCAEHSFEVVVLDYIMPSMTGIELLNRIRAYRPTIRSIIVSGKLDTQVTEQTLTEELRNRIEADIYLHKPLENSKLVAAVDSLVKEDEKRSWADIAERNVNAKKRSSDVKEAERSMSRLRRRKK